MFSQSKKSEIERGGRHFSNKSEIQKSLKYPIGWGVKPIWEKVHNFPVFLIMMPPLSVRFEIPCSVDGWLAGCVGCLVDG